MQGSARLRLLAAGLVLAVQIVLPGAHLLSAGRAEQAPATGAPVAPAHHVDHCLICIGLHQAGKTLGASLPPRALDLVPTTSLPLARLDVRAPRTTELLPSAPPRAPPLRTLPVV